MKTHTLLAAALAALLFPLAAPAQDDPTPAVDPTQGEPELPPMANPETPPVDDPRVPTAEQLEEPMTTPPEPDVPPPDIPEEVPLDPVDRWGQLDADGDGRISTEEGRIDADFHSNFEMMDANSDGFIDSTELDRTGGDGNDDDAEGDDGTEQDTARSADRDDHTEVVSRDPVPEKEE